MWSSAPTCSGSCRKRSPSCRRPMPKSSPCATRAIDRLPRSPPFWTVMRVPRAYAFIAPRRSSAATCMPVVTGLTFLDHKVSETCLMRDPHKSSETNELDDVDRLFARLDRAAVPEELTARVLASTVARSDASRAVFAWPWMVAGLTALGLLSLAAYQLGVHL